MEDNEWLTVRYRFISTMRDVERNRKKNTQLSSLQQQQMLWGFWLSSLFFSCSYKVERKSQTKGKSQSPVNVLMNMTALLIVAIWIYHRTAHHISPLLRFWDTQLDSLVLQSRTSSQTPSSWAGSLSLTGLKSETRLADSIWLAGNKLNMHPCTWGPWKGLATILGSLQSRQSAHKSRYFI